MLVDYFFCLQDVQDIRAKRYQAVMEKGGVVMVDDQVLLGVLPGKALPFCIYLFKGFRECSKCTLCGVCNGFLC